MKKLCTVIMLPTKNKSHIYHFKPKNILGYISGEEDESDLEQFPCQNETQNQHLYILTDDKIKEDDWCIGNINGINNVLHQCVVSRQCNGEHCKKIIASTKTSLNLPSIPLDFIKKYVESNGKIDTISVEFINITV